MVSSSSSAVRGRTTSTGLSSLGRSSSIFGRSNSILRKDAEKLREREREEKLAKEGEERLRDKDRVKEKEKEQAKLDQTIVKAGSRKPQRPRLSVATRSGSQQTVPLVEPHSPQPARKPKPSILRRVRSGSSLKSPEEEQEPSSPIAMGAIGKRKKGVFVDRIVRGLDSAMEFVDGK